MTDSTSLKGKRVLVAGATAGIGKATTLLLSRLGAEVILLGHLENELQDTLSCLDGRNHHSFCYDLADLNGIEQLVKEIVSSCGPFDGFVHCVGVRSRRPVSMITPEILNKVISINLGSFIELVRCITKKKCYSQGLSIVAISSVSSQRGNKGVTAYAASKAAMDAAVRCLAKELASKKIRVNTVVPAQINTPAYTEFIKMSGETEDSANLLSRQYLGLGEPSDVANLIAFLLSDNSGFITGASLPVDGGFLSS